MRNFKILIQYEGTKYQGWQRQESTGNTIQGKFEAILSKMTDSKVQIDGSGRTDADILFYQSVFYSSIKKAPIRIMFPVDCSSFCSNTSMVRTWSASSSKSEAGIK